MNRESDRYGTTAAQAGLLELLTAFDAFCTENGIRYSLASGTLLGAVRHHGFIPWDDDADVMMDRNSYERFLSVWKDQERLCMKQKLWIPRIQRPGNGAASEAYMLDIFIADHCPDSRWKQRLKCLAIRLLQGMMHERLELRQKNPVQKLLLISSYLFGRLFTGPIKYRLYERISKIGNRSDSRCVCFYNDVYRLVSAQYDGDLFSELVRMDFEDRQFPVCAKWDHCLRVQYGDYMTPPPPEQRVPQHI